MPRVPRLASLTTLVGLVLALGTTRCGLLGAPGDYESGGPDTSDGAADASVFSDSGGQVDGSVTLPDGNVVPASVGTLALVAGQRDPTSPEDQPAWASDAWSGVLDSKGHVASWRIEKSAPIAGVFDSSGLVAGKWLMINVGFGLSGGTGTALQQTSWTPGIAGDWIADNALGAPGGLNEFSRAFFGANLVFIGGTRTVPVDGGSNTFFVNEVHTSTVDASKNALGASVDAGLQILHARARPALAFGKTNLYVVAGRTNGGLFGSVEMAPVDPTAGTFQAFTDQPTLMTGGAEHKVMLPGAVVSAGFLFVAGGRVGPNTPTDVVLSAAIDPKTGALAAFQTLTQLPTPLYDHAFLAFKGRLYVAGGVGMTTRSDAVFSAAIGSDGTIGAWSTDAKLPAARSAFAALAY